MTWKGGQSPTSHVMSHTLSGSHHPPTCTHSQAVTTLPCAHTSGSHLPIGSHHPPMSCPHTLRQSPPCTHSPAVTTLPHAHTLRQSPPSHMHTLSGSHHPPTCTHSPAESPPSHMHTLSGSHLPPMSHSGSHHPASTCTQSGNHPSHVMSNQAVTTLPCHVTHTITVMDPKLMLLQFLQFV